MGFGMQAIYKKRFVARALQERGIGVFVDLNVANKFYAMNLLGVPRGYKSFCTRGYEDRINALEFEYRIAQTVADGNRFTFVVYGGGEKVKAWCREHECIYISSVITMKNKVKSLEKQLKQVALPQLELSKQLEEYQQKIFAGQAVDYSIKQLK